VLISGTSVGANVVFALITNTSGHVSAGGKNGTFADSKLLMSEVVDWLAIFILSQRDVKE
jgi:hypothetical protein